LFAEIKKTPHVAASALKRAALDVFNELMSENMLRMRLINIAFASVIAFGVVYNAARISLSERSRELATLRVLGFTQGEVGRILLGELAVLTVLAIPAGLVFGWGFAWLAAQSMETRSQRFPFVIEPATYGRAVIVVVIAAILSSLVVWRRIRHLDLVAVLKSRE
jgi:putative ABC transport system permease protein